MEQYIKKSTIVEEINRVLNSYDPNEITSGRYALISLRDFLDNLEVKEIDFEKELDEWMKIGPHTSYPWCTIPDAIKITAEHFFELGLSSQTEGMKEALRTEYEKGRADVLKNSIVCRAGWYDGFFLDYSQEQQDTLLEKIGVDVGDKVRVILMKE